MEKSKPNVVFILVDDLGYGDISLFNPESKIKTENIDKLAKNGMIFNDSHSCSALCTPSRYGLLTGRYNWRSRLKSVVLPGDSEPLIEKQRLTMPKMFKQAGYQTACVGKWHLGMEWELKEDPAPFLEGDDSYYPVNQERSGRKGILDVRKMVEISGLDIDYSKKILFGPNEYGFEYFFGTPASLDQGPYVYVENNWVVEPPIKLSGDKDFDRNDPKCKQMWPVNPCAVNFIHKEVLPKMQKKVIELIDEFSKTSKPFFLYYPMHAVHAPLLPTEEFEGKSGLGPYGDIVLQLDSMVGEIVKELKEKELYKNTIIVFTSDNGCASIAGFEELEEKGHNPSYLFRGKKGDIYEGGHRVPTIVSWPEHIREGSLCEDTVCHVDFFQTFASILEETLPENVAEDSVSNLPLWKEINHSEREGVVYSSALGFFAIKKGIWKLVLCEEDGTRHDFKKLMKKGTLENFQLYNMEEDKKEEHNVIEKYPEIVEELLKLLSEYVKKGRSTIGGYCENDKTEFWPQIFWMK